MTTATGSAMIGSLFVACGLAGVLWRYFSQPRNAEGPFRYWQPPKYLPSYALVAVGLILIVATFFLTESRSDPAPFAVFVAGLAVGLCLATPGVMIFAGSLPDVKQWGTTRQSVNPPWRAQLGMAMIVFGVAGGVVASFVIVALR